MKLFYTISFFLLMTGLYSCTKVIHINLNDSSPQLVIEGSITDSAGPYSIKLSKTVNFEDPNVFPAVSGAFITITDANASIIDTLTETVAGTYQTHIIQGIPGHTYLLNVFTGGQDYTSTSTMPMPVPLDSLTFITQNNFGTNTIYAVVNFQDPANVANYYNFTEYINGRQLTKDLFAYDDEFVNGKYNRQTMYTDSAYIKAGDTVAVKMDCVDKGVYTYFNT